MELRLTPVRALVGVDRRDDARLRVGSARSSLVGETFPRPTDVGLTPKAGNAAACAGGVEVMVAKMLRAEEIGDAVSDLCAALSKLYVKAKENWNRLTLRQRNAS